MTQQYLVRQMSQLLSDLNAVARDHGVALEVVHLRREAETTPPSALTSIVTRALGVAERLCWDSLDRGPASDFARRADICAELWEFAVCAGLLEDR